MPTMTDLIVPNATTEEKEAKRTERRARREKKERKSKKEKGRGHSHADRHAPAHVRLHLIALFLYCTQRPF